MNMSRIIKDLGALAFAVLSIAATYVALVPAKLVNKGAVWPFVVGMALVLIGPLLWRLATTASGERTTILVGALIFVVMVVVAVVATYLIVANIKNFSLPQAGWGALSGALLLIGYFAHYFTCVRGTHGGRTTTRRNLGTGVPASSSPFGVHSPASSNPTN